MKQIQHPRKSPTQTRSKMMVEAILETTANVVVKHGYAGTNTNLVAQLAGVSVGSVYQYFPNKDSLIAALHYRKVKATHEAIQGLLTRSDISSLQGHIEYLVRAFMTPHTKEPELHRLLEQEFSFLNDQTTEDAYKAEIPLMVQDLLGRWADQLVQNDIQLAAWLVTRMIRSLVHAYVIECPDFCPKAIEKAICDSVMGYLCGTANNTSLLVSRARRIAKNRTNARMAHSCAPAA
ncbi:TetR/AcrR family transcriptional regulator [Pseudomonas sp. MDT1-85]